MSNITLNRPGFVACLIAVVLMPGAVSVSQAHDIWLMPERFTLNKGDTLVVHQLAGGEIEHDLQQPGDALELPILYDMTPRFELITADTSHDLLRELPGRQTRPDVKPVLKRALNFNGPALIAMDHALIYTSHTQHDFLHYLEHEAFDKAKFQVHMGSRQEQSEAYARSLKTLVQVGETMGSDLHKQVLGQKLEILLLQDPYRLDAGADLDVQVLFDGEPLPGAHIKAYNSDGKKQVMNVRARTNNKGIARFNLNRGGIWLLRLVHLLPCSQRFNVDCSDADWESYWASYSFKLD